LLNFALFDLVGLQLSPRIRDLGKITPYRGRGRAAVGERFPAAGPLLSRRINTALITENWDEMLRLAASLKYGQVTASLIVAKLSRADRLAAETLVMIADPDYYAPS
jgi:TnpA family transposase